MKLSDIYFKYNTSTLLKQNISEKEVCYILNKTTDKPFKNHIEASK